MVYLKVSFDLYVPRVFFHDETLLKCLLTFWLYSLVHQQGSDQGVSCG